MKITKKGKNVFPEFNRYARIIKSSPSYKTVTVYYFDTIKEAEEKARKLRGWKQKAIAKARDDNGRFAKGSVLICCK